MASRKLEGRIALITGASRGIGRAIARGFAAEGAAIAVTARSEAELQSLAAEVEQAGGQALAIPSKHGVLGLTRSVALEVARDGITVNAICPGPVHTEMNDRRVAYDAKRLGVSFSKLESRLTPIGRRLEPEEIVPMAILLASDESGAITGQAFNVCGGVAT